MGGLLPAPHSEQEEMTTLLSEQEEMTTPLSEQEEMTKTNLKETATPQLSCLVSIQRDNVQSFLIVQELCESRGDRPGLSVLTAFWFPWT